ncbi:hypothetical protein ACJU26_00410 [Acidithiobacillus sp. M4-SHS-6]|uniref:hypothetical protein n=1 Tax=Acidithiobacillus sp. M4-SHS-6 TaxID=3383024 RepID=UPI0039BE1CCC
MDKIDGMAQRGELPASKIGTQWRFDRNENFVVLECFMNDGESPALVFDPGGRDRDIRA